MRYCGENWRKNRSNMKKTIKAEVGYDYIEYCKEKNEEYRLFIYKNRELGMRRQNINLLLSALF